MVGQEDRVDAAFPEHVLGSVLGPSRELLYRRGEEDGFVREFLDLPWNNQGRGGSFQRNRDGAASKYPFMIFFPLNTNGSGSS